MNRKIISLILILTLIFNLHGFGFVCYAAIGSEFAGGSGTETDPWQIESVVQLNNVRNYLGPDNHDKYFILISDINMDVYPFNDGKGWDPIGDWWNWGNNNFQGTFDGAGYTISGLYINDPDEPIMWDETDFSPEGLFGEVSNATIKNINLVDVYVTGYYCVGAIAGSADNSAINNINVTGTVSGYEYSGGMIGYIYKCLISYVNFSGSVNGFDILGGLVAYLDNSAIRNSSSSGTVVGNYCIGGLAGESYSSFIFESHSDSEVTGASDSGSVGGLVGTNTNYSTIDKSYATGNVIGTERIGGLVGINTSNSKVFNSYASGSASSNADDLYKVVGGLVGTNSYSSTIKNCYAVGLVTETGIRHGGLLGNNYTGNPVLSSYSLGPDNGLGEVVTDEQMKTQGTFTEWDFVKIWGIEADSYPYVMQNIEDAKIISLLHDSSINVPYGTTLDALGLPKTIFVILDDNTTVPLQVDWNDGNPLYEGTIPGDYVFTGTLKLVDGIENPDGLEAIITVTVWPEPKEIISVEPLPDITVPFGTYWHNIGFPVSVNVTLEDNSTIALPVTWNEYSTPYYNSDISGTYLVNGEIRTGMGEANTNGYFASVKIVVALPPDSQPVITGQPEDISVNAGETATFSVEYTANPEPDFQWQFSKNGGKKWTDIPGANLDNYEITQATVEMNGYLYRVIIDNGIGGPVTSNAAKLSVTYGIADIQIAQRDGVYDPATNEIVWHVNVYNNGPETAQGVVIKNSLANNTKLLSVISDYGYSVKGKSIIINVGKIEANQSIEIEIRVLVSRVTSTIENTATVTSESQDPDLSNNSSWSYVLIQ